MKLLGKTLTALLAEIFHPGSPKVKGSENSSESEGGRSWERMRVRGGRVKDKGDFDSIVSMAPFLCQSDVCVSSGYLTSGEKNSTLVPEFSLLLGMILQICPLHSLPHAARNMLRSLFGTHFFSNGMIQESG